MWQLLIEDPVIGVSLLSKHLISFIKFVVKSWLRLPKLIVSMFLGIELSKMVIVFLLKSFIFNK